MSELVRNVADIKRACNPEEPLEPSDPRYVDLSSLHVGDAFQSLYTELGDACEHEFLKRCISGHRGSGKSTQLLKLCDWANKNQFCAYHVEVTDWFGNVAPLFTELFLLAAYAAADALEKLGKPLPQKLIDEVASWFNEVTIEDKKETRADVKIEGSAQGEAGILLLGKLILKFTAALQGSSAHAQSVREKLRTYPDVLLERANVILEEANRTLKAGGRKCGLILVFDNLDRYEPDQMEMALFRSSDLIRKLKCHAVFTVPLGLAYAHEGPIQDCYGDILVQPMISLRESQPWGEKVTLADFQTERVVALREVLARRIDIDHLFEVRDDVDQLVYLSGGCLRDVMHLVGQAAANRELGRTRLSGAAIQKAIQQHRATYARPLEEPDWLILAQLTRRQTATDGQRQRNLLHRRAALLYQDTFGNEWYSVHPLLVETPEFQNVYQSLAPVA